MKMQRARVFHLGVRPAEMSAAKKSSSSSAAEDNWRMRESARLEGIYLKVFCSNACCNIRWTTIV